MKTVLVALISLMSTTVFAAPIQFYRTKPVDGKTPSLTSFKAGETIYATAQFDKPLGQMLERKFVPVRIETGGEAFVAVTIPVNDKNRNDTSAGFYIMGPGQEERVMRMLAGFLSSQGTGKLPITIVIGPQREAQGALTLHMAGGKQQFDKLIADSGKSIADSTTVRRGL